jgi:hypothetical protein
MCYRLDSNGMEEDLLDEALMSLNEPNCTNRK